MRRFENTEEGKELLTDLLEKHKHYILTNVTPVDSDVENQKTRIYKILCWIIWGHIFKNGVCGRCGKIQPEKNKRVGK